MGKIIDLNQLGIQSIKNPYYPKKYKIGDTITSDNMKYKVSGNEIWRSGKIRMSQDCNFDSNRNIYGAGLWDTFNYPSVYKFTPNGTQVWTLSDIGWAWSVFIDGNDNLYVAYTNKYVIRKLNTSGVELWSNTDYYDPQDVVVDGNGNMYIAYLSGKVRKMNSSGTQVWISTDVANAYAIRCDKSGNVYVAYLNNTGSVNVRKFNNSGTLLWSLTDLSQPYDVLPDDNGNLYIAYDDYSHSTAISTRKVDANGNQIWALSDFPEGHTLAKYKDVIVVGSCSTDYYGIRFLNASGTELGRISDLADCVRIRIDETNDMIYETMNRDFIRKIRIFMSNIN